MAYPLPVPRIQTRRDALRLFAGLKEAEREMLGIAYLGSERMLLGLRHVAGVTDAVAVPMTRIVRDALFFSASAVMIAHNHPDGDPRPSPADLSLTRRLTQGLAALDVMLLDHLILGGGVATSLREEGMV
ncbi:JAB domain-containing protein [uncultured Sphingomonas sp.]|uniref:JAB domain-containing protein n=1 Tax=uncultured Sphingomonas sp. TaxID=158754 RepID=UPI0025D5806F|nr:JAB domain-containing protein [uncultured Sphingomonas sp.]